MSDQTVSSTRFPIKTITDQIADGLRADIISGLLSPGEKLNEGKIAADFGVSRGSIRVALFRLAREGLLDLPHNKAAMVSEELDNDLLPVFNKVETEIELYAINRLCGRLSHVQQDSLVVSLNKMKSYISIDKTLPAIESELSLFRTIVTIAAGHDLLNVWCPAAMRTRRHILEDSDLTKRVECHEELLRELARDNLQAAEMALRRGRQS